MRRSRFRLAALAGAAALVLLAGPRSRAADADETALWSVLSGVKVFPDTPPPDAVDRAVRIRAARNEADAAQLVVRPARPLFGFLARGTALAGPGGTTIPADRVEVLRVRYVNVERPTDAAGHAGPWPDPLPPFRGPIDLAAGANRPLWVRVTVPPEAVAGVYTGTIVLTADGWRREVPLAVEVFDFAMPDRTTLTTAFGFDAGTVLRYHGVKTDADRRSVIGKYLAALAAHHLSPYDPAPLDPFVTTWPDRQTLVPVIDWTAWDAAMTRAIEKYGVTSFRLPVPGLGGGTFHSRVEPSLLGCPEGTPEYDRALGNWLSAVQKHLEEKGWLDYAFVYWFDEPAPRDYPFVRNGFAKLRRFAPKLTRMLTEQVDSGLVGGPDVWCPITPAFDDAAAAARRKEGERFWWYVCTSPKAPWCGLFIDHPGPELRVWLWQTWQHGLDGILVWQTTYWTSRVAYPDSLQNPYEDPMSWVSGYGTKSGAKRPWGNGDGRFLYPPEAAANGHPDAPVLDGPVDSIRIEMLRDGIEDHEYLSILRQRLFAAADRLSASDFARYEALLAVPTEITSGMKSFTTDPRPIEARRLEIARAIEALR